MLQRGTATAANERRPGCANAWRPDWLCDVLSSPFSESTSHSQTGRWQHLKAAGDINRGQPEGSSHHLCLCRSAVAASQRISRQRDSLCCACGRLARWLPAGWRTKHLAVGHHCARAPLVVANCRASCFWKPSINICVENCSLVSGKAYHLSGSFRQSVSGPGCEKIPC